MWSYLTSQARASTPPGPRAGCSRAVAGRGAMGGGREKGWRGGARARGADAREGGRGAGAPCKIACSGGAREELHSVCARAHTQNHANAGRERAQGRVTPASSTPRARAPQTLSGLRGAAPALARAARCRRAGRCPSMRTRRHPGPWARRLARGQRERGSHACTDPPTHPPMPHTPHHPPTREEGLVSQQPRQRLHRLLSCLALLAGSQPPEPLRCKAAGMVVVGVATARRGWQTCEAGWGARQKSAREVRAGPTPVPTPPAHPLAPRTSVAAWPSAPARERAARRMRARACPQTPPRCAAWQGVQQQQQAT